MTTGDCLIVRATQFAPPATPQMWRRSDQPHAMQCGGTNRTRVRDGKRVGDGEQVGDGGPVG